REAITHSQLQHPNILPFLGIYCETNEAYPLMVLPYLKGGSLEDMLKGPKLGVIDLSFLIIGAARGTAYLHSRMPPIIHGDLHPGNILINELSNPVICDFGRSRIRHEFSRNVSNREQGGRICFLAPEILDSQTEGFYSSQESDIFGLSMMYFNTWSGHPPFAEITNEWHIASILIKGQRPNKPAQSVDLLDQTVKTEFWTLLTKMWTHEPTQRPSSSVVLQRMESIFAKCECKTHSGYVAPY
ncbi:kinase-like protein, partial [Clavulina sp. PMI_390]